MRMRTGLLAVLALLLAGCGAGAGGQGGGGESGPVLLGQIASLTGNYTPLGTNDEKGAAQAIEEINAAGGVLGGRQLQITFAAAIFGGLNRPGLALVGGLVLGVAEAFVAGYLSGSYQTEVALALMLAIMIWRASRRIGVVEEAI